MAKINDTVAFPIRAPANNDLLIGSDRSDTSNSAGGETVNFEVSSLFSVPGFAQAIGNLSAGGIGTYVLARCTAGDRVFGATVAGSSLFPASAVFGLTLESGAGGHEGLELGSALSGTWRCMGRFDATRAVTVSGPATNTLTGVTLWLRIS